MYGIVDALQPVSANRLPGLILVQKTVVLRNTIESPHSEGSRMKGFFLPFLLLAAVLGLGTAQAASSAEAATANTRTYDVPQAQAYDAVLRTLGQLGMTIESSNPAGGYVKSTTATVGLVTTLEITNVYVQPNGDGSSVRIERLKGKLRKPKPDTNPAPIAAFFAALDQQINNRAAASN